MDYLIAFLTHPVWGSTFITLSLVTIIVNYVLHLEPYPEWMDKTDIVYITHPVYYLVMGGALLMITDLVWGSVVTALLLTGLYHLTFMDKIHWMARYVCTTVLLAGLAGGVVYTTLGGWPLIT